MRRPIFTNLFLLLFAGASAQQLDLSTLYRYNWQVLNPASINHLYLEDKLKQYAFNTSFRQQWIGFEGAPASYNARFEYLPNESTMKLGLFATGDKAGAIGANGIFGNFAYQIYFNRQIHSESYLSFGLNVGAVWYNVDMNEIRFQDDQPGISVEGVMNQSYADMGLGCFYRWKTYSSAFFSDLVFREFYAGLSVPQTFTMDLSTPQDGEFTLERIRHYYLITGGILQVSNKVLLEPSLWVRHVPNASFQTLFNNAPLSGDFNCRVEYDYRFWAGVGASTNRLLHFEAGFNIGRGQYYNDTKSYIITLALAYDAPVGWNSWLGPSTEISVGIGWD